MIIARSMLVFLNLVLSAGTAGWAQGRPERAGFWASVQPGYGVLDKSSKQDPHIREGTFALAFNLGGTLNRTVRYGVELNGWLLESNDMDDPAKGESVSQFLAIILVYPMPTRSLFLKAGVGRATYTNHNPFEFGSSGWGKTLGVGYDVPIGTRISLTPVVSYSQGGLGGVENQLAFIQNRTYSVFDIGIALTYP